jgi:hypothetical protein
MYWIWESTVNSEDEAMIYGVPEALLPLRQQKIRFDLGKRFETVIPPIVIARNADSQGKLNDNLIAAGTTGLLFSKRLRNTLSAARVDNIDYYSVRIENPADGTSTNDYSLANIVGSCACVDLSASDVELDSQVPGKIRFIESLKLDESLIQGLRCFRLFEHLQVIVVHEDIKHTCEQAGISGVRFTRPADFSL